jgi:hypothetical protein
MAKKIKKALLGGLTSVFHNNPITKQMKGLRGEIGRKAIPKLGAVGAEPIFKKGGKVSPAWQRKEGKNPEGGLNAKGVASYRRENPGSKLKMAVTTKPSKLKPGSKAAKRRKSFCARMSGVEGPMKKPNGKPTRKALALRKWNC